MNFSKSYQFESTKSCARDLQRRDATDITELLVQFNLTYLIESQFEWLCVRALVEPRAIHYTLLLLARCAIHLRLQALAVS